MSRPALASRDLADALTAGQAAPQDLALRLWRKELATGARTLRTSDALWEAACWESGARALDAQGSTETAARCRATARQIVVEAAGRRPRKAL